MLTARFALVAGGLLLARAATAANTYYVATDGSDSNAGTMSAPFGSWAKAQSVAAAGDTVYFRGGRYKYTAATATCGSTSDTVNAVVLTKSGTSGNPINYFAYPNEKPVFDFSGITDTSKYNCRQAGVRVEASWLHLKGLELTGTLQLNNLNHESWCVYVYGGSNNTFEMLDAHHNNGPGFFIQRGGNNLFLNCDSHENEDTMTSNGDGQSADGFGCHPNRAGDSGNVFRGCRAWWNSDDAWDFINATEACTVESSWAWYSGYKPDAVGNGAPVSLADGNGNGFKGGGYGDPQTNVPNPTPQHVIQFNVAFYNKANGLYANHSNVSPYFYNNTSFNNGTQIDMLGLDGTTTTSVGILRNNLAYSNNRKALTADLSNGGPISDMFNSWDSSLGVTVSDADFQSVAFQPPASCPAPFAPGGTPCCPPDDMTCFAGMASARQADGSLPVLPFLRLAADSDLIDKGMDIGFTYVGKAPDLGAFEYGATGGATGGGGSGGSPGTGGGSGGTGATGGRAGAGGTAMGGHGGAAGAAGRPGTGGGSGGTAGAPAGTGGSVATGTGGFTTTGGQTGSPDGSAGGDGASGGGCSCATAGGSPLGGIGVMPWLVLVLFRRRRLR
ncbi:MAG TPA: right-handed parallel beta-helix repeat-containing protein [Polyangia bacterium]|nr:right-handed parallel beta-helix repeat-containing protein [Polyangia bacterium]